MCYSVATTQPWLTKLKEKIKCNRQNLSQYINCFHLLTDRPIQKARIYTCQLFLRYKREIFILGVLGFLKTTRSFPRIPEEVQSLPKMSEVCRSLPKASSLPVLFTSKIRDREEGIVIYSFYTWFSFLTWVWVKIFLEIVSSKTASTHIFQ